MDKDIEELMEENDRLRQEDPDLLSQIIKPDDLYIIEKEILKYFTANEKRILKIQSKYQEKGIGLDIVTSTELAIKEDVFSSEKDQQKNLHGLIGMLQYLLAVKVTRDKSPEGVIDDNAVFNELKDISKTFRPNYVKYVGLVNLFLEAKAPYFQKKFHDLMGPAA